jgi:hypothetical protein
MIAHIQFRHKGEDVPSLLVFNFGAIRDVIMVVPQTKNILPGWRKEEKEEGILFNNNGDDVWVCPNASINQFPDTFSHLKTELLKFFNKKKFEFRRRRPAMMAE